MGLPVIRGDLLREARDIPLALSRSFFEMDEVPGPDQEGSKPLFEEGRVARKDGESFA